MNTMLGVLLALTIFVTFCDAQCTLTELDIIDGSPQEGCKDTRGVLHEFDTQWEYDCLHCSCDIRAGLTCCNVEKKPKSYDRLKCKLIFIKDNCTHIPVKKADPSKTCKVSRYIG